MTSSTSFMTVHECAREMRVSPETIRRLIRGGWLPAARVGRQFRIPEYSWRRFMADGNPWSGR